MKYIDNSSISEFRTCPRKFQYVHRLNLRGNRISMPLAFGSSWHAAMDIIWGLLGRSDFSDREVLEKAMTAFKNEWEHAGLPWIDDASQQQQSEWKHRNPGVARETLYNYIKTRRSFISTNGLVQIEQPFAIPLSFSDVTYIGKMDKVIRDYSTGRLIAVEHKTTAMGGPNGLYSNYIEQWSPNSQIDGYITALKMMNPTEKVEGVWVDAALISQKHNSIFKFIPISSSEEQLSQWLHDTCAWIEAIRKCDEQGYFPKNTNSCFNFNQACTFRNLCFTANMENLSSQVNSGELPEGYKVEKWEPYDTLKIAELLKSTQE